MHMLWGRYKFRWKDELLLYTDIEEKLLVYNSDFSIKAERISRCQFPDGNSLICVVKITCINYLLKLARITITCSWERTETIFVLLYISGIYLAFFLFILLIRKITIYQLSQRENLSAGSLVCNCKA